MTQEQRSATISVLVENEAGILARVIGLFTGRGYNIDSLTVAAVDPVRNVSRINIVTSGTDMVIEQIKAQLDRLVQVYRVADLSKQVHQLDMAHMEQPFRRLASMDKGVKMEK
jgi:acetolactate synthase-1/3 small subunit